MNTQRLRKILEYSDRYQEAMADKVRSFYAFSGLSHDQEVLNIMQIVRPVFQKKGYLVLELPIADEEIGALCYKGDTMGYIVLNTSLPKVNINFAVCHELYHVFYQNNEFGSKIEFSNEHYYEHDEEFAANLFAGMLLMPEGSFRRMYFKFREESNYDEMDTILRLMNYYQAPYMSVLIRCYTLKLPETESISGNLLNVDRGWVQKRFGELWLDDSVLDATMKDDYSHIEAVVKQMGGEYVEDTYLNQRTLKKVLQNMAALYAEIKEG